MFYTINLDDAFGIVNSTHKSPEQVLGMHLTEYKGEQLPVVRCYLPDAKQVSVIDAENSQKKYQMFKIHHSGLFEVLIRDRKEKFRYKLELTDYNDRVHIINDVYAFWNQALTDFDRHLFNRAHHYKIYEKMGSFVTEVNGVKGVHFSLWAPNAQRVSVVGNFNNWDGRKHLMKFIPDSGIWELFIPDLTQGDIYKFEIKSRNNRIFLKADPYARFSELRPNTASVVYDINKFEWSDRDWMERRSQTDWLTKPVSIYEVHLQSWIRGENNSYVNYRELAHKLCDYVKENGFTHIELLPIMEHPLDESWGYQVTGYFSPTSRLGTPDDFMYFVNHMHQNNIAILLDWVPAHFPKDSHGLAEFDGTCLYEHSDPRQGEHSDWGTKIFNYGRFEVANFLMSNAMFWLDKYHIDGLRVDAVASMLYLDYSKKQGQWIPNKYGGKENLEAIEFIKHLNTMTYKYYPGIMMIAEESTAWPGVSKPVYTGGLGFGFKWNMGWMNDTLQYITKNPIHRKYHHSSLTFSLLYAFSENFILPFSHDEVVHGKRSMKEKMPGDQWQQFANLRALYTYFFGHPGKKLLFMGSEFGAFKEWRSNEQLDWYLLDYDYHKKLKKCIQDLNNIYKNEPAMSCYDNSFKGFEWINCNDWENSVFSFMRKTDNYKDTLIFVINFTPVVRSEYRIGVYEKCMYKEIFNSDSYEYHGVNIGNAGLVHAEDKPSDYKPYSLNLNLPPLGGIILKPVY